jgi:hypothetical protein
MAYAALAVKGYIPLFLQRCNAVAPKGGAGSMGSTPVGRGLACFTF